MSELEANFSLLVMSIGSSATIHLGLTPDEHGQTVANKAMAKFNIDLLAILKEKSKGNLTPEEGNLLESILNDLQLKYIQTRFE